MKINLLRIVACIYLCIGLDSLTAAQMCSVPLPKNLRPDTITVYSFGNRDIPIKHFQGSKPLSNYRFKTKYFNLIWLPFFKGNDSTFISRTIFSTKQTIVLDTISMSIFEEPYRAFVVKEKRHLWLAFFPVNDGKHGVFIATINKKKRLNDCVVYIKQFFK